MINEILEKFIQKYGKEEGIKKYRYDRSLECCILKYGKVEGKIKYTNWKNNVKSGMAKISLEEKEKIKEKISKSLSGKRYKWYNSLEEYIKKYGKEEGIEKYNAFKKKVKENTPRGEKVSKKMKYINSKQYYIDKYGEKEGKQKYKEWKQSQDHSSLRFFIKKYGEIEGTKKYFEVCSKKFMKSYYSKISQDCFNEICKISNLSKEENEILFGENELQLYYTDENNVIHRFCYDFCYRNKIIEFNGDRWHCNPNLFQPKDTNIKGITAEIIWNNDKIKYNLAKSKGYDVFIIWESDWKNNKINTINKVLNFLGVFK